jgi:hypothetical protein
MNGASWAHFKSKLLLDDAEKLWQARWRLWHLLGLRDPLSGNKRVYYAIVYQRCCCIACLVFNNSSSSHLGC